MNNIIRLTTAVNKVNVANPKDCLDEMLIMLKENPQTDSDIILFPRFSLISPSAANLAGGSLLIEECESALNKLREYSHKTQAYVIAGLVTDDVSRTVSELAILQNGNIIAHLPTEEDKFSNFISEGLSEHYSSRYSVLQCGNARVAMHLGKLSELVVGAVNAAQDHCDILLVPAYQPMVAGSLDSITELAKELSKSLGIAIAIVNGGVGDTSMPYLFNGFIAVYEAGKELAFDSNHSTSFLKTVDVDLDVVRGEREFSSVQTPSEPIHKKAVSEKTNLLRRIEKNPFLPASPWERERFMEELFDYQVRSLAARMTNTGIQNLVIGVSGGIDSTSALMVAVATCDYLELPRTHIHGITLPGLGTSDHTYYNALALLEQLGVTRKDISIRPAVLQHFQDIGHSGEPDTTYENAQARERTQVLLDLANMVGALVVGTGDLSEEALGFSTFGGDHLSSYNVNTCMTKTMLRKQLEYVISTDMFPDSNKTIQEVLDTPISPELLPPSEEGEILQRTEDILGPYELHEFFLYYFVRYNMKPSKIYKYAITAFSGKISEQFIKEKLALFIRKFCANQFKRSCAPDAASINNVNLLGVNYSIPSDLDPTTLLKDLERID